MYQQSFLKAIVSESMFRNASHWQFWYKFAADRSSSSSSLMSSAHMATNTDANSNTNMKSANTDAGESKMTLEMRAASQASSSSILLPVLEDESTMSLEMRATYSQARLRAEFRAAIAAANTDANTDGKGKDGKGKGKHKGTHKGKASLKLFPMPLRGVVKFRVQLRTGFFIEI